jgi:hypothetical protein
VWIVVVLSAVGLLYSLATLVNGSTPFVAGSISPVRWIGLVAFCSMCFGTGVVTLFVFTSSTRAKRN